MFLIFYKVLFAGTTPGRDGVLFTKQLHTRMRSLLKLFNKWLSILSSIFGVLTLELIMQYL